MIHNSTFIVFSVFSCSVVVIGPCGQGGARAHPHDGTRTDGTERARHPPLETAPAAIGRGGAVRPPWLPQNRPRAAPADAWTRSAAVSAAGARFPPPTARTRRGGSRSRGGSAPQ